MIEKRDVNTRMVFMREAANVIRCHTLPWVGPRQTVGQHTFGMLTLALVALGDDLSPKLMRAIIEHDLPERFTGDIPSPCLRDLDEFTGGLIGATERINEAMGTTSARTLSVEETRWLNWLDKSDLFLTCAEQFRMGNNNVAPYLEALQASLNTAIENDQIPTALAEVIINADLTRLRDGIPADE